MCLLVIISYYIAICGATVALPLSDNSMTINKRRNLPNNTIIYSYAYIGILFKSQSCYCIGLSLTALFLCTYSACHTIV